jgi:DNA-binding transcriptional ArsR family regulator
MAGALPFLSGSQPPEIGPSAPTELAWLAHLVAGRASYSDLALAELNQLLPELGNRVPELRSAYQKIWPDDLDDSTELLVLAKGEGALLAPDLDAFLAGLEAACRRSAAPGDLRTESDSDRQATEARLQRLRREPSLRRRYRTWLGQIWEIATPVWQKHGRSFVAGACADLGRRLDAGETVADWLSPRHPGAAAFRADRHGGGFAGLPIAVSPIYFCMSGGTLVELGGVLHLGLPGNSLAPSRKFSDAAQVASLIKILSEPARVAVLLHLLTDSGGVMEISRQLRMSQPVVSGHLKQLREAGLVAAWTASGRTSYSTDLGRVERVLEDVKSLITHWRRARP